jgi:hypothetical protein
MQYMSTYTPDLSAQWERREPDQPKPKRKYYEDDLLDYFFSDTPDEEHHDN